VLYRYHLQQQLCHIKGQAETRFFQKSTAVKYIRKEGVLKTENIKRYKQFNYVYTASRYLLLVAGIFKYNGLMNINLLHHHTYLIYCHSV